MSEAKLDPKKLVLTRAQIRAAEQPHHHPWNPRSGMLGAFLARAAGLKRVGLNIARLPPGNESFVYHRHWIEEEWIFILAGRGEVEIEGERVPVGQGDFVAFPLGVAHQLFNTGAEELEYLMGGEQTEHEIADFPRHNKRMVRHGEKIEVHPLDTAGPFVPGPK